MKKIISFSVWGADPKYINGCFANIELAKQIYPNWQTRFYCAQDVPKDAISKMVDMGGEVVEMYYENSVWEGLFWRFLPASENDVDIFISRDIDSRINYRERAAVDDWLTSNKNIHCMRDHIEHNVPILGGMWGCRNKILQDVQPHFEAWQRNDYKGSDQDFLREIIWKQYKNQIIAHDKFFNGFTTLEVVRNVEEFMKHREELALYREKTIAARQEYIQRANLRAECVSVETLSILFPEVPEVKPLQKNENGEILSEYVYHPVTLFGDHDVRPFPAHEPMLHGTHVGEIIS